MIKLAAKKKAQNGLGQHFESNQSMQQEQYTQSNNIVIEEQYQSQPYQQMQMQMQQQYQTSQYGMEEEQQQYQQEEEYITNRSYEFNDNNMANNLHSRVSSPSFYPTFWQTKQPVEKLKSFSHIRFAKDYQEILKQNLSDEVCLVFVSEPLYSASHIKLRLQLMPQQGLFAGKKIPIFFIVTKEYPYKPVLAFAEEFIYHPNVNNSSHQIYWKILDNREWKPTLTLYFIILQLKFAFIEPDLTFVPNTPECIECAELFQCNPSEFLRRFSVYYSSNDTSMLESDIKNKMKIHEIFPQIIENNDMQTMLSHSNFTSTVNHNNNNNINNNSSIFAQNRIINSFDQNSNCYPKDIIVDQQIQTQNLQSQQQLSYQSTQLGANSGYPQNNPGTCTFRNDVFPINNNKTNVFLNNLQVSNSNIHSPCSIFPQQTAEQIKNTNTNSIFPRSMKSNNNNNNQTLNQSNNTNNSNNNIFSYQQNNNSISNNSYNNKNINPFNPFQAALTNHNNNQQNNNYNSIQNNVANLNVNSNTLNASCLGDRYYNQGQLQQLQNTFQPSQQSSISSSQSCVISGSSSSQLAEDGSHNNFEAHLQKVFQKGAICSLGGRRLSPISNSKLSSESSSSSPPSSIEQKIKEQKVQLLSEGQLTPKLRKSRTNNSNTTTITANNHNNNNSSVTSQSNGNYNYGIIQEETNYSNNNSSIQYFRNNSNNDSTYNLSQQQQSQPSEVFSSLLDTTSCQVNPKRRKFEQLYGQNSNSNTIMTHMISSNPVQIDRSLQQGII